MDVKLVCLFLVNCVVFANCQSTTSNRNEAIFEFELLEDMKSEIESIRRLLMNLQQTVVRNEKQAIGRQEVKLEIEDIRNIIATKGNESDIEKMKSEIKEIRQLAIQQQDRSGNGSL